MNQRYSGSAYFAKESDARRAADDLRARGYDADVHSEGSHGQSFWDSVKNFFRGEQGQSDYSAGALLMFNAADPQIVRTVVQQYNGRMSDVGAPSIAASEPPIARTTPVGTADIGTTTMPPPATGVPPSATSTIGETDELERDRIRTTGGGTTGLGGGATTERGGIDDTGL